MIDFDWYRSFVAIYRAGTVTRAAESRLMTQPAVSQHLAALEAAIGRQLFRREPRRMVPTEYGQEVYARIAHAIDTLELLGHQMEGAEVAEQPLVRLGAPAEYYYVVALERLAMATARMWIRFGDARGLLDALARDELDLVIATQRLPAEGVEFSRLADERFLLVSASDLQSPGITGPDAGSLAGMADWLSLQRWISYGVDLPIVRRFWQQVFGRRPQIQPALVIPDLRAILRAVELGQGISLIPHYMCQEAIDAGRVRILWQPPKPVTNELWLAYRRTDRSDPDLQAIRLLLQTQPNAQSQ